jgi:excisionase family DNA binding protein
MRREGAGAVKPPERLVLKPDEVAQMLSIGRSKVYALIASGELPSIRIGKKGVRIPYDALRKWVITARGGDPSEFKQEYQESEPGSAGETEAQSQ